MTHPITPREKVDVREIALAAMTEMRRSGESYEMCARWISERVNTALASGSGDHAELARLAEAASGSEWQTYISGRPEYKNVTHYVEQNPPRDLPFIAEVQEERDAAFIAAANPATVLALLAENAALRGENEHVKKLRHQAIDRSRLWEIDAIKWETRATEAERKLAEAVIRPAHLVADYQEWRRAKASGAWQWPRIVSRKETTND